LLSIWEGSGNVICLDVLRALEREPEAVPALRAELERAASLEPRLEQTAARLLRDLDRPIDPAGARRFTERLALVLQGAALAGAAPSEVIDGFFASRLGDEAYRAFGTLPDTVNVQAILERARPRP
jgi:putative acyl-CoA dehydrogenase